MFVALKTTLWFCGFESLMINRYDVEFRFATITQSTDQ
jgi:hypothetical protein